MADLRADVIGQIEELSTLVGDLVDLSQDDAGGVVHEQVDIAEVVDRCLEQVRRRRNDIEFDVDHRRLAGVRRRRVCPRGAEPARQRRQMEPAGRPGDGLRLNQVDPRTRNGGVRHGTGHPARERRLVFERFYRSTRRGRCPVPGLGLAIVKQVVLKHGGALRMEDTVPGGRRPAPRSTCCCPGAGRVYPPCGGRRRRPRGSGSAPRPGCVVSVDSQSTRGKVEATNVRDPRPPPTQRTVTSSMTDHPWYSQSPQPGPRAHQQAPPGGTSRQPRTGRLPSSPATGGSPPSSRAPRQPGHQPGYDPTGRCPCRRWSPCRPRKRSRTKALAPARWPSRWSPPASAAASR